MKRWIKGTIFVLIFSTIYSPLAADVTAQLPDHSSSDFGVNEYFIGSGGEIDATSASYSLRGSLGDLGIGNSASSNYQIYGGYTTTAEPFIEMAVNTSAVDLGVISDVQTGTGTATFQIRNYLSEGYVVKHYGTTLINQDGDEIDAITTGGGAASSQGTEQFGFNLKANTSPASFGAEPQQVPDATFSYGIADGDYDTADVYKFVSGDTIASSPTSTGVTIYTISYIANSAPISGAGLYQTDHAIVTTATY